MTKEGGMAKSKVSSMLTENFYFAGAVALAAAFPAALAARLAAARAVADMPNL